MSADAIAEALGLSDRWAVMVVAMLPVLELRGAIPWGAVRGVPGLERYLLAVAGNLIPVVPLLLGLGPVARRLRKFRLMARFFDWFFERTRRRAGIVERYEALGLVLFVAIPLPITGAWTGCAAASLFGIRLRYAAPAIALGVIIAGIVVSIAVESLKWAWAVGHV